ncbi:hypothetical protein BGX38DRAFT_1143093 [Terfezia claveryi]|nr:hypothetical protein BGX38DRAFT_1143093 [Terfezia claveryi]
MSYDGGSDSQPNDSWVPSDINASDVSYFDEFPELLQDYPGLFGLSGEDWAMTVDQSTLDTIEAASNTTEAASNTIEAASNTIEAQSDTTVLLQEPASSTQVLPSSSCRYPHVRPIWNCYHCDACGFTNTVCGEVSRHIRNRPDHDPQSVSVSWVGDHNVKLVRGFISGEVISTRWQRVARKHRGRNKKAQETRNR